MEQALRRLGASAVALGVVTLGIAAAAVPASADPGWDNPSRRNPHSANYDPPVHPGWPVPRAAATSTAPDPAPSPETMSPSPSPLPLIVLPPQTGGPTGSATPDPASATPSPSSSPTLPPGFAATEIDALTGSGPGRAGSGLAGTGGTWLAVGAIAVLALGAGTFLVVRRR